MPCSAHALAARWPTPQSPHLLMPATRAKRKGKGTMTLIGGMSAQHLCRPRERRPTLGHHWFIPRAVGAAAAAHSPKVEVETAAGMTAPTLRRGVSPTMQVELHLGVGTASLETTLDQSSLVLSVVVGGRHVRVDHELWQGVGTRGRFTCS